MTVDEVRRLRIVKHAGDLRDDLSSRLGTVVSVVGAWCSRVLATQRIAADIARAEDALRSQSSPTKIAGTVTLDAVLGRSLSL